MLLGQLIFDGLAMGLVYVILATGLVLITSVNKIIFTAYGMFYTMGAYMTWYAVNYLHLPYFLALVVGAIGAAVIGVLSYAAIFRRIQFVEGGFLVSLVASLGLQMVLSQGGLLLFGTLPRSIPTVFKGTYTPLGMTITLDKLVLIAVGVVVCIGLFLMYVKTRLGRSMRAVAFVPEAAALQGMNATRICMITMGVATAIAGIAGGILAPTYGINAQMGNNIIWSVMLMTMLGGMDSLLGALAGGLVIGQILSFGQFYLGGIVQVVVFVIIGVVLKYKPNGLLGRGVDIGV
jgi:branched-chain amino acid transport system permease protein